MFDVFVPLVAIAAIAVLLVLFLRWCMRCEAAVFPNGRHAGPTAACACGCRRVGRFCATCGKARRQGGATW